MYIDRVARRAPWTALAVLITMVILFPAVARGALWYDFAEPYASATGPEVKVFDYSSQKCATDDIPDQPARAFRDSNGMVNLIDSHHTVRRKLGNTLLAVTHQCAPLMVSGMNSDPSQWDGTEWLASPYTQDGSVVHALVHAEHDGWKYGPGYCIQPGEQWADKMKCWYNAITLATSTDSGATFSHATPPGHYVASVPYQYTAGAGPNGFFSPSNIVRGHDGYHYVILHVERQGLQETGACLWRTRDLSDRKSWRAWSGSGFTVRFLDPYVNNIADPSKHVCAPLGPNTIQTGSDSLTWNTYFKKWLLVRATGGGPGYGFYTHMSDDLINWAPAQLMMNVELPWSHTCGEPDYVLYPSLLDPQSTSRNFETTGQRPELFFTHFNVGYNGTACWMAMDRDLLRIPVEFSNQVPGGPTASLAISTTSARTGEAVQLDASGSSDSDGSIARYEWDLDGNGTYEHDTGTNPVAHTSYAQPDDVTVTVRVSDDEGKATDETEVVHVTGPAGGSQGGEAPRSDGVAAPTREAGAAVARFRLAGTPRTRRDGSVVIRAAVPAAGRLQVRGAGLRAAGADAAQPGTITLRVRPSARGRARLRRAGRVRVRARIAFTPVGGTPQTELRTLRLRLRG